MLDTYTDGTETIPCIHFSKVVEHTDTFDEGKSTISLKLALYWSVWKTSPEETTAWSITLDVLKCTREWIMTEAPIPPYGKLLPSRREVLQSAPPKTPLMDYTNYKCEPWRASVPQAPARSLYDGSVTQGEENLLGSPYTLDVDTPSKPRRPRLQAATPTTPRGLSSSQLKTILVQQLETAQHGSIATEGSDLPSESPFWNGFSQGVVEGMASLSVDSAEDASSADKSTAVRFANIRKPTSQDDSKPSDQ